MIPDSDFEYTTNEYAGQLPSQLSPIGVTRPPSPATSPAKSLPSTPATSPAINLPPATGEAPRLGTTTELVSPPPSGYGDSDFLLSILCRRFSLLNHAKDLLRRAKVRTRTGKNPHRTIGCHHYRIDKEAPVDLVHVPSVGRGIYANLQKCSNVWACPVCSAKISERRRVELETGLATLKAGGYSYVMVTFTIQHTKWDSAEDVKQGLKLAKKKILSGAPGGRFKKKWGYVGQVVNTEPVVGGNGWHIHLHVIFILNKPLSPPAAERMEKELATRWKSILEKNGRFASVEHGVKVSTNDRLLADYLTKMGRMIDKRSLEELKSRSEGANWTESHEMAKGVVKSTRRVNGGKNRTPMDLLAASQKGDKEAGELWLEYVQTMVGTHQLHYGQGMKKLMGLEEKSDEDLANEKDEVGQTLARLWADQFKQVRQNDILAELQFLTGEGDQEQLKAYMEDFGITGVIYPALGNSGGDLAGDAVPAGDGLAGGPVSALGSGPGPGVIDAEGLEWSEVWEIWIRPAALAAKVDPVELGLGSGPGLAGDAVPVPAGNAAGIEAIQAFNDFVARWNAGEVMESEFFSGPG